MRAKLQIDNVYEDGVEIQTTPEVEITMPPDAPEDSDTFSDWLYEEIFPHTGTDRFAGNDEGLTRTPDATYYVKIVECDEPALVGKEFEF